VSVQDLKPDPQDTSAFYLENIFQLLAGSNISRSSIPSAVIKPPSFSPPTYAVWVNSFWSLSLVVSLTCALLATLAHQWARRYVRNTQPPRCSPEKRARTRAFFSEGAEKLYLSRVVETTLPTLVHLSLFLFFGGLLIFLFNTNRMVFDSVTWWIAFFSIVYGWITLMPIFRHDSPYYAPLSAPAWLLYSSIRYITFELLSSFYLIFSPETRGRFRDSRNRYRGWVLRGRGKAAEETMLERSSEIDLRILDWAMDALGEDDTVEKLFEAIPRFFRSNLVNRNLPVALSTKFWEGLDGFLGRTLLSNSVFESVKIRRVITCMNATNALHGPFSVSKILYDIFEGRWGQAFQSVETGYTLAHWCTGDHIDDISNPARCIVASILARGRKRTDRWVTLAADQFGIPEHVLRDHIDHGDSVLLSILNHLTRKAFRDKSWTANILWTLSQFNTRETLPRLQHEFCALWNEIILDARDKGAYSMPLDILREIRLAYIDLHRGTDALPTAFSASTGDRAHILYQPSSYPQCDVASHCPDSATQTPLTSINSLVLWTSGLGTTFGDLNNASHAPIESQPLPTASLDIATIPVPQGTSDMSTSSLTARPIPPPISSTGNPPRTSRKLAIGPSVVSDSIQPPVPMATLGSGVDPPSTVEFPRIRSDDIITHALGSPSSSRTYRQHAPQFRSVLERHIMLNVGTADAQHDAADVESPTPMEVFHHLHPSASADLGTSEKTSPPEDHQHNHD
jgi:hypothetical protein